MQPFKPFVDPDVQAALQRLIEAVSAVAIRQSATPHSMILAAAAIDGDSMDVDTLICGEVDHGLVEHMADCVIQTAENGHDAETFVLPRPN